MVEAARAIPLPDSREIIHVVPRHFLVDNQEGIKDPVGMSGVRLEAEAHLITALERSEAELSDVARRLRQGTLFAVPKEQLSL